MNQIRYSRRDFLRISAIAAGATLVACTPVPPATSGQEGESAAGAPTAIQFWWGWTPELHVNAINAAVDKFMTANPDVQVTTGQHEWGERLYTALAAGTPPDLFNMVPPAQFAARGAVIPLDDYMSQSEIANKEAFPEALITQGSWRGNVYGVAGCENFALLGIGFNQRILQEAGLAGTVDDLPTTWGEALEQTKEYSKIDAAGNIDLLWYTDEEEDWAEHGAQIGIHAYDAENETFHFDHEGFVEYFEWMQGYYDFLGVDQLGAFFSAYPDWAAVPGCSMCVGRQAGAQNGYWWPGELSQTAPDETFLYNWNPMPAAREGVKIQMIGIHHNMIAADSPNPEAAWRLAEFMTSNEAIQTVFDGAGFLVATKRLIDDPSSVIDVDKYEGLRYYVESLAQADELWAYPACPIEAVVIDQFTKARDAVIYHEKSVEQALADLQSTVTEELQKALNEA